MIIGILKYLILTLAFILILRIANYLFKLVYLLFFKKEKTETNDHIDEKNTLKMLQCEKCKTYILKNEAYIKNGKFFCKKDHAE